MNRNKNRKTFEAIIQVAGKQKEARVYRIVQNKPKYIGQAPLGRKLPKLCVTRERIISYLKEAGEILGHHQAGDQFSLFVI